jgi:hypothetical protein
MLPLGRLFNAVAPGSVRFFSAAAASGENSFKVGGRLSLSHTQVLTYFVAEQKGQYGHMDALPRQIPFADREDAN